MDGDDLATDALLVVFHAVYIYLVLQVVFYRRCYRRLSKHELHIGVIANAIGGRTFFQERKQRLWMHAGME